MLDKDILIQKTKDFLTIYFTSNDFEQVKTMFASNASWVGASDSTIAYTPEQFDQHYKFACVNNYHPIISITTCDVLYQDNNIGIAFCKFHIHIEAKEVLFDLDQRATAVYKNIDGDIKIINLHVSTPNDAISQEEFYTNKIGKLGYQELQRALKKKTEQIEMIVQTTAGGMKGSIDDEYFSYFYVNDELCKMLGYTYDEFMEVTGGTAVGAVYPPDLENALADVARCFAKGPEYKTEYRMKKKDGHLLWVMDTGRKVTDENGQVIINSIITDISELKEMVNQLKIDQERYEIVAQLSNDIIFEYDVINDLLEYQQPSPDAPIKNALKNFLHDRMINRYIHPDDIEQFYKDLKMILSDDVSHELYKLEYRFTTIMHDYIYYRLLLRRIYDNDNQLIKLVGKAIDISSELQLKHQSITDPLTGIYNRLYITSAIQDYCQHIDNHLLYACILIDIDYFKKINDTYGHIIGDSFLIETVKIIKSFFRSSDFIARIGGDEFLVFIKDIYDRELVYEKVTALITQIHKFIKENNYPSDVSISMGVYIDDKSKISFKELYNKVDIALYHAKNNGRDCFVYYHEGMTYPK